MRIGLDQALHVVGRTLVKHVGDGMKNGPKSGRTYSHPKRGTYQASAPGEYSAVVTGDLLGSINYSVQGMHGITFYATSGHAGYQEDGTSKMEPRENLWRAIQEQDGFIASVIEVTIARSIGA
jgi:hypothetical protein